MLFQNTCYLLKTVSTGTGFVRLVSGFTVNIKQNGCVDDDLISLIEPFY